MDVVFSIIIYVVPSLIKNVFYFSFFTTSKLRMELNTHFQSHKFLYLVYLVRKVLNVRNVNLLFDLVLIIVNNTFSYVYVNPWTII